MLVKKAAFRRVGGGPGSIARPYLQVRYLNPHSGRSLRAWPLIDTGADDCVLPADYAVLLGHDLKAGGKVRVRGVHGHDMAYQHTTVIEIPGFSTREILISFIRNLNQPLLGVRSFLSHFELTVDYPNENFSLGEVKKDNTEDPGEYWPTP
jgi:predicted aspartyl protease